MHFTLLLLTAACCAETAEDLHCLKAEPGEPAPATLFYAALQQQAYAALDRRKSSYEQLKTPEQIQAYQHSCARSSFGSSAAFPSARR